MDSAWDTERLNPELEALDAAGRADHPYLRYYRGDTRADLGQVQHLLLADEIPVRFTFRRLSLERWNLVENTSARSDADGRMAAIKYSLDGIDGAEVKIDRGGTDDGPLSRADLERVRALCGHDGFVELGKMAIAVSRGLLDSEKKP
jgi:hypothetical protein